MRVDEDYKAILKTEWSYSFERKVEAFLKETIKKHVKDYREFLEYAKKAMIISFYKYGKVIQNHGENNCMDAVANLKKRLEKYEYSKNTEWLRDVYNFAMIEYMCPHPKEWYTHNLVEGVERAEGIPRTRKVLYGDAKKTRLSVIKESITEYEAIGKLELLPRIAALTIKESIRPSMANTYFKGTDSCESELIGFGVNQLKEY